MAAYLYYDTIRLNPSAGGVLTMSAALLDSLRRAPGDRVQAASERHPRLFAAAQRLKLGRFVLETLLYNVHLLRGWLRGERAFSLFPNYFLPFTPLAPLYRHRGAIVVVHDLQHRAYPQHFAPLKRRWLDWNLRRLARSLAQVVFISGSSRDDFERHFGPCRNATVILNPVDAGLADPSRPPAPAAAAAPGERYLIAAYHYYPHKNFAGILALFERMRRRGLVDRLDITGNGAGEVARMVAALAPEARDCVRHRGLVPRQELLRLYRGAAAFISLSTFEGFNLSAAEAATLGVPLLLSDIPVHRELFGGYGLLVGADDGDNGDGHEAALDRIAHYLAEHRRTRPAWPLARACAPEAVAARYLGLQRDAGARLAQVSP